MTLPLSTFAVQALAQTLLHFVWQAGLLWALAQFVLIAARPRRPQTRYAVYLATFLLLAVCPLATFGVFYTSPQPAGDITGSSDGGMPLGATTLSMERVAMDIATAETFASDEPLPRIVSGVSELIARYETLIVAVWLAGTLLCAARIVAGALGVWLLTARVQALPDQLQPLVTALVEEFRFRTRPAVVQAERISQAMAVGLFQPMVLLPACWVSELPPEALKSVVAHELAHVRRWDLPINFLQRVVESLLFFHPVVWWCSRQLRIEREMCCDELALRVIGDRAQYATALGLLAEGRLSPLGTVLALGIGGLGVGRGNVLLDRIHNVLGTQNLRASRLYGPSLVAAGALVASLAWLAVLTLRGGLPAPFVVTAPVGADTPSSNPADVAAAPTEQTMQRLPTYTIEPPDILLIEASRVVPKAPYHIQSSDTLKIEIEGGFPGGEKGDSYQVDGSGRVNLGPLLGKVKVAGRTEDEAAATITEHLAEVLKSPQVSVQVAQSAGLQPIAGEHAVAPDGTVNLGSYGQVYVAGMTISEAQQVIEKHLAQFLETPQISVSVFAYNSKVYYVIVEGVDTQDQIQRHPITGNETVLDALSQVGNINRLSNKQIWIARPAADRNGRDVILPVNWRRITQSGATATNYQVLPGDRIFISASGPPVRS